MNIICVSCPTSPRDKTSPPVRPPRSCFTRSSPSPHNSNPIQTWDITLDCWLVLSVMVCVEFFWMNVSPSGWHFSSEKYFEDRMLTWDIMTLWGFSSRLDTTSHENLHSENAGLHWALGHWNSFTLDHSLITDWLVTCVHQQLDDTGPPAGWWIPPQPEDYTGTTKEHDKQVQGYTCPKNAPQPNLIELNGTWLKYYMKRCLCQLRPHPHNLSNTCMNGKFCWTRWVKFNVRLWGKVWKVDRMQRWVEHGSTSTESAQTYLKKSPSVCKRQWPTCPPGLGPQWPGLGNTKRKQYMHPKLRGSFSIWETTREKSVKILNDTLHLRIPFNRDQAHQGSATFHRSLQVYVRIHHHMQPSGRQAENRAVVRSESDRRYVSKANDRTSWWTDSLQDKGWHHHSKDGAKVWEKSEHIG